jgi:Dolichyl-phosphate-mannose-protein mannosyltransferase
MSLLPRGAAYFGISNVEFVGAVTLLVFLVLVKTVNVFHQPFDSDEPQHLHVIWSWVQGHVQYRDVFDNHMPLFQIMLAPIAGLIGERATILYWMRFLMLPLYFVAAWCVYQIGTQLFSRRAGLWSVIAVGWYPAYCSVTAEFRTDNLWAPLWLLCLAVLVRGTMSVRRALVAGLLLGFCFGVSMKSTLFLLTLLVSAPLAVALVGGAGKLHTTRKDLARCAGVFVAATILIPAIIAGFFAAKGVWRDFSHDVFGHQLASSLYKKQQGLLAILALVSFPLLVYVARRIVAATSDSELAFRRTFIFFVAALYFLLLKGFWPIWSHDDYPALFPLIFLIVVPALFFSNDQLTLSGWRIGRFLRTLPLPAFLALGELVFLIGTRPFWVDNTYKQTAFLRNVLALTKPGDYVFDCKGETIFRQRCFRPVMETITRRLIQRGLLRDTVPQDCIKTGTCVVATMSIYRLSPETRRFIERNYLPVTSSLRVAGAVLKPSANNSRRYEFDVVIPARYELVPSDKTEAGILDGAPYRGARFLSAGHHAFEAARKTGQLVLLWAQAVDRHFMPLGHNFSSDR